MEAKLIRRVIEKYIPKTLFKGKCENYELLHVKREVDELERLATIGAKIEKVFKDNKVEGFLNATWNDGQISSYSGEFIGLEELLMFSEEEE